MVEIPLELEVRGVAICEPTLKNTLKDLFADYLVLWNNCIKSDLWIDKSDVRHVLTDLQLLKRGFC